MVSSIAHSLDVAVQAYTACSGLELTSKEVEEIKQGVLPNVEAPPDADTWHWHAMSGHGGFDFEFLLRHVTHKSFSDIVSRPTTTRLHQYQSRRKPKEKTSSEGRHEQAKQEPQQQQHQTTYVRRRTAYSIKMSNIALNPWASARNALSAARDAALISSATSAAGAAGVAPAAYIAPAMAVVSFIMAAHFLRRLDVRYEDACVLHAAWQASEWVDGRHLFDFETLLEEYEARRSLYATPDVKPINIKRSLLVLSGMRSIDQTLKPYKLGVEHDEALWYYYELHETIDLVVSPTRREEEVLSAELKRKSS